MKGKFGILLAGGFIVLSSIAAATGNFALRLEQAAQQALPAAQQQAAQATQPAAPFRVERVALAQSAASGYRQFQARSNTIAPGTPFHIYFEPANLTTRFANGAVQASMSVDILVRNARGETVASRDNAWQLPISRAASGPAPLTQVYGDLMLNQLTFPDGRYQLVLRIHDDFSQTFADQTIDIELRTGTAASARLTQAGNGARR